MNLKIQLIPRIAIFSALIYVLSYTTFLIPNFNFLFFIVFVSGLCWGVVPGMLIGAIGMGLWTSLNPYGPAPLPIMLAQVIGASLSGLVGNLNFNKNILYEKSRTIFIKLILSALLCTLLFYIPVNLADAWFFQPFKERFIVGMSWSLISIAGNIIIFPLLFNSLKPFLTKEREKR